MFLSKHSLVLPLLLLTAASMIPVASADHCKDDCDFKFDLNFAPAKKGCFWLTKNKKKASKRKETYCAKSEISNACEATCSSTCENESTFQFKLANSSGADKNVKCAWISKNRKKSASRKEKYCVGADDAWMKRIYCKEACGRCSPNQGAKPTPEESAVNVVFNLQTDNYPEETSWALVDDAAGTVIKSDGAGYPAYGDAFEAYTLHSEAFALKRCVYYTLTVYDSFGDGLSPLITTPGYFEVFVEGQRVMGSSDGVAFESSDSVSIYVCEPTPEEPTPEESAVNVVFNLQTDEYPEETSWALIEFDANGMGGYTYIKSDGKGYPTYEGDKFEANTLYSEAFELKRCVVYVLMVFDNVWDGLSGIYTPGYFEVFVEGQRVMGSSDGVAFGSSDSVEIYVC